MIFEYGTKKVERWLPGTMEDTREILLPCHFVHRECDMKPLGTDPGPHHDKHGFSRPVCDTVHNVNISRSYQNCCDLCCLPCRMCQVRDHCTVFTSLLCLLANLKLLCSLCRFFALCVCGQYCRKFGGNFCNHLKGTSSYGCEEIFIWDMRACIQGLRYSPRL